MKHGWKKTLAVAVVLLALAAVLALAYQKKTSAAVSAKIITGEAKLGEFTRTISSSGKTKADKSVELKFPTSGKLVWVGVKEGDPVNQYQAIAALDKREVQKNLEKSLRDYAAERNDFDEARKVTYGNKANTDVNDTARRILEKNQWDLEKAVLDVELKNLALEYSTLITPINGILTRIDTPVAGVHITPASAVFTVSDPSSIVFEANVDETDIAELTVGQEASVALDAYPETTFPGTITYISFTSQQSSGGATVFPVKVTFSAGPALRIGMNGDISIVTLRQQDVLMVPAEAVREEKGGSYVYRKTNGTYQKVSVTPGAKNQDVIVITAGLADGDAVVIKGFTDIPK